MPLALPIAARLLASCGYGEDLLERKDVFGNDRLLHAT